MRRQAGRSDFSPLLLGVAVQRRRTADRDFPSDRRSAVNRARTRASAPRCCARGRPGTRAATSSAGSTQALNSILTTNVGGGPIDQDVFDEAAAKWGEYFRQ